MRILTIALLLTIVTCSIEATPSRRLTSQQYQRVRGRNAPVPQRSSSGIPFLNWITPTMLIGGATSAYTYLNSKSDSKDEVALENKGSEEVVVKESSGETYCIQPSEILHLQLNSLDELTVSAPITAHTESETLILK